MRDMRLLESIGASRKFSLRRVWQCEAAFILLLDPALPGSSSLSCSSVAFPSQKRDIDLYQDHPDLFPLLKKDSQPWAFFNRYNVPSMQQEIEILSGKTPEDPEWLLFRNGDAWTDLHYAHVFHDLSREDCVRRRVLVRKQQSAAFASANTFILTLGLCEAWFDCKSQAYLNVAPPPRVTAVDHERFEFHFIDFERNLRAIEDIYAIISQCKGNDNFELILTVSPVPLNTTFTDQDVVVANSEAKSILRAVAGEATRRFPRISYFPAYEIVNNSEAAEAWQETGCMSSANLPITLWLLICAALRSQSSRCWRQVDLGCDTEPLAMAGTV